MENLDRARAELVEYEPKVVALRERAAGTGRAGLVHDLARFVKFDVQESRSEKERLALTDRYEAEHGRIDAHDDGAPDREAQSALPEHERGLEVMRNRVKNLERDLADAESAKAALDALGEEPEGDPFYELAELQPRLTALKARREKKQADLRAIEDAQRALAQADEKTGKAAQHHADVAAWTAVADALAPDGIPAEILEAAIAPVNARLTAAAIDTGWQVVHIEPDMSIIAKGRPYALLSESEKWRVDAMIAEAVAFVSGLRILVLDRVDVLDLPGRSTLLGWLDALARDGEIETALLFATLKALPAHLPDTIAAHWVAAGVIEEFRAAA
jgi:hypothetical protein